MKIVTGLKHKSDNTILRVSQSDRGFLPMETTILAQILFRSQIGLKPMSWKEANCSGGRDCVKVETKRLFQSSWLNDFSCLRSDKRLT